MPYLGIQIHAALKEARNVKVKLKFLDDFDRVNRHSVLGVQRARRYRTPGLSVWFHPWLHFCY